jgi:hypothetical protein
MNDGLPEPLQPVDKSRKIGEVLAPKRRLALDPIRLNRIEVWILRLRMIFSENRLPLFGIML